MYRGGRPHRGGYHPPPSRGFGPRPGPGHPPDRGYHPPPDPYRRPSPRRRYSSPGARDAPNDYRGGERAPPPRAHGRYSPSPPRGGLPVDHSLVITVGNELNHPPGQDASYVRDYSAGEQHYNKPYYSPRRSSFDDHSDRGLRRRSISRGRSRGRSRSPGYGRSRSRPRGRSRGYSRSRSPERAKSRGRSKSRPRGRSHSRSRSRSGSRRSRSRGRSRRRSHGRSHSVSRSGRSSSSSSSSRSSRSNRSCYKRNRAGKEAEDFSELEKARRRKEIQDTLVQPAKSILKKRVNSSETDSPMLAQNSDSPRGNPDGGLSQEAEQILCALKTMDPDLLASMLGKSSDASSFEELLAKIQPVKEGGSDLLLPHEKGRQDLAEFLGMMAEVVSQPQNTKKSVTDIEDEEKFLYGDEEEADVDNQMKPAKEIPKDSSSPDKGFTQSHDSHRGEHSGTPYAFSDDVRKNRCRSSATPEKNANEQLDFPPGVGPQEVKVRKEVEEYEKIQDLLKTIGLDLGVAEISKMAVRTQERLHGKIPVKKSPVRRQMERKRKSRSRSCSSSSISSSSRSSSRSRSSSYDRNSKRSRKKPVVPEQRSSRSHSQSKKESRPSATESGWPTTPTVGPGTQPYPPRPSLPAHPVPPYPPPSPHGVMPPDYPPHGYDPYGNYVPYMPPGWPMYPPPGMPVPSHGPLDPYNLPKIERPFLKVIEAGASEAKAADKKVPSKLNDVASKAMTSDNQRKAKEDLNTASQKQKVIEELEKLKEDKEIRLKRKENLLKEIETLRKQQGELLRKKRREKDGHKDPVLIDLSQLQEDAMAQISKLRAEERESDKKHEELVKIALILGIDYKESKISGDHTQQSFRIKRESTRSPEKSGATSSTSYNKVAPSKMGASPEKVRSPPSRSQSLDTADKLFEYYDAGNHWCKNCNLTSGSMFDFFMHLHNKVHRKTLDPYDRPWAKSESDKKHQAGERTSKPAKGSEFLIPVRGFFCQLCEEFLGDPICAEAHVTCHAHNEKYKTKMYENPLYEQRRNLDRQAGLKSQKNSEHKRKREDNDQDDVKKSKHCKDGGKTLSAEENTKPHFSKDEEYKNIKENENKIKEERLKYRKEDGYKQKYIKEDDERPKYKQEEEERYRFKKEEEYTHRYRKEEAERSRYEEDRYRNKEDYERYRYREEEDRNRFRKDDDRDRYSREEEKSRYGREEDKRYKYTREAEEKSSKHKDEDGMKWPKSKWEEEDENDGKYEKKDQKGKAGYKDDKESTGKSNSKSIKSGLEKPSEPPKILCGPSPALLAKLRKKNEDGPARPGFGKFSRKKPQKTTLEKEAERMAAQFIREDEESVVDEENKDDDDGDPFSKSLAAAKSIAIKLSGKPVLPPSNDWLAYNENKCSPNLPPPATPLVIRKSYTGVQNKPTAANKTPTASESPGSVTKSQKHTALSADIISKAFSGEEVQFKQQKNSSAGPADIFDVSAQVSSSAAASQPVNATQIKPVPRECVVTLESDVAAPGVPEEEQKLTVILRPPPQLSSNTRDPSPKTLKPKTLAAGKAKDLFDIFYSTAVKSSINIGDKQDSGFKPSENNLSNKKTLQSIESNKKKETNAELVEEPCKNQDITIEKSEEAPKNENTEVTQSQEALKNEDSEVRQVSEDANLQPENLIKDKDIQDDTFYEQQACKVKEISEADEILMEVSVDTNQTDNNRNQNHESNGNPLAPEENPVESDVTPLNPEGNPLESKGNILETVVTPLDSEEPMSLSPLPGSFAEQLNLDTFEFSFEPL